MVVLSRSRFFFVSAPYKDVEQLDINPEGNSPPSSPTLHFTELLTKYMLFAIIPCHQQVSSFVVENGGKINWNRGRSGCWHANPAHDWNVGFADNERHATTRVDYFVCAMRRGMGTTGLSRRCFVRGH